MRITKRLTNLEAGTIIERPSGIIVLVSGYMSHLGVYAYVDTEVTGDGEIIALDGIVYYATSYDLIGGEILW